jgi:hypothetical protein
MNAQIPADGAAQYGADPSVGAQDSFSDRPSGRRCVGGHAAGRLSPCRRSGLLPLRPQQQPAVAGGGGTARLRMGGFLGMALAIHRDAHLRIDLVDRLSGALSATVSVGFRVVMVAAACAALAHHGLELVSRAMGATPALRIPISYLYGAVPAGAILGLGFLAAAPPRPLPVWAGLPLVTAGIRALSRVRRAIRPLHCAIRPGRGAGRRCPIAGHGGRTHRFRNGLFSPCGLCRSAAAPAGDHQPEHGLDGEQLSP